MQLRKQQLYFRNETPFFAIYNTMRGGEGYIIYAAKYWQCLVSNILLTFRSSISYHTFKFKKVEISEKSRIF